MKEKIKKNKVIFLVIFLILLGIGVGIWQYQHQTAVKECKIKCWYNENSKVWEHGWSGGRLYGRSFPSQEQCIDYCLTIK